MNADMGPPRATADLRKQAEEVASKHASLLPENTENLSPEATRNLIHELRVHHIELEMQNEELRRTQVELDSTRQRYFDFYHLAPVGYVTLNESGVILEANLTAAGMLGVDRGALVNQPLSRFIHFEDQDLYYRHRKQLFDLEEPQAWELRMIQKDGTLSWVHMQAGVARDAIDEPMCRLVMSDITARKQAEEALRISEEKFTKIFKILPDAIDFVRTADRVSLAFNQAFANLFGFRAEEFIGKPVLPEWQDLWVNIDDRSRLMASLKEHGKVLGFEAPLRRKDGSTFVAEIACSALEIDGELYHLAITRDMTERKRAMCALQESEERYQRITVAITDYIYTVHVRDGCVAETIQGPGCIAVTGYHAAEFANDPFLWFRMVATDDRPKVEEQVRRILAGEAPPPIEHRIIHKNGEMRWVRNTFVPHRDEHGALMSYDGLIQDITERKQGEDRLRESEDRFKKLFNEAPLGIALTDSLTGHVYSFNPMFAKILDRTMEEMAQIDWMRITHPDDFQKELDSIARLNAGEINGFQMEKRYIRPAGETVWVSMTISRAEVEDKAHPRHLCMIEDITERKQAEEALQESEFFFRESQRAAGIGSYKADFTKDQWVSSEILDSIFGITRGYERSVQGWLDIVHPEDRAMMAQYLQNEVIAGRKPFSKEYRIIRNLDGATKWVYGRGECKFDEGGRILSLIGTIQDITERKQAEMAQHREREFTRALLDNQIEGVVACDENGQLVLFNRSLAKWHGMDALQLPQEEWAEHYDLFEADGITPLATHAIPLVRAFNGEVVHDVGLVICAKNQPPRHVLCNGSPILDKSNRRLGAVVVMHDITQHRENLDRLQNTLHRLELATTSASMGVWDWNLLSGSMTWDDRMFELHGATHEEIHGTVQDWKDGLHPEDLDRAIAECEAAIRGEAPFDTEFRLKRKDGTILWIKANALVLRDEHGKPIRMIGLNQDITDHKQAEDALRESTEKFIKIFHLSPDAIVLSHLESGVMAELNQSYLRMFSYTREELLGHSTLSEDLGTWVSKEDRDRHVAALKEHGEDLEFVAQLRRKDGSIFIGLICSSLLEISGKQYNLSIIRDISERLEAETSIRRMNEELDLRVRERTAQLEAANKEMEAFSYSVSHDLRAPLRSISGFSQALAEDYKDQLDEDGKHYLARIHLGAKRMGHLIDDLLKLSKTSRAELTVSVCDLSRLCSRVAGDLADLNPERRVEVAIQPGMLVQADHHLLQVVLENLLGNAWKFTSKSEAPRIEVDEIVTPGSGERTFFIRDNGAGFDMAHADKLFNAFQRLHKTSDFEGTGIGLSIVQRIIHRHGGRVWAEAEPGKGATFFFTFPNRVE